MTSINSSTVSPVFSAWNANAMGATSLLLLRGTIKNTWRLWLNDTWTKKKMLQASIWENRFISWTACFPKNTETWNVIFLKPRSPLPSMTSSCETNRTSASSILALGGVTACSPLSQKILNPTSHTTLIPLSSPDIMKWLTNLLWMRQIKNTIKSLARPLKPLSPTSAAKPSTSSLQARLILTSKFSRQRASSPLSVTRHSINGWFIFYSNLSTWHGTLLPPTETWSSILTTSARETRNIALLNPWSCSCADGAAMPVLTV